MNWQSCGQFSEREAAVLKPFSIKTIFTVATTVVAQLSVGIAILSITSCTPVTTTDNKTQPQSSQTQPEQTVKITGAGSVYPALEILAAAYEAKVKNTKVIFLPNNQTSGGITGVKDNLVDIGSITRPLKAEENNGQMEYREFGKDALLVATHPSVKGVTNLQTKDIKAIYSGRVKNWRNLKGPDAAIVVLDRPEDESAKKLLRKYYLGEDLKIAPSAVILQQESELSNTLKDTPDTIGAFSLGYANINKLPVNPLSLDGVAPTTENVLAGKYKMVRTLGIVWKKQPSAATQGFIDFIFSPEAAKELLKYGFAPATANK